jgi:uncharacterized membrane protein YdfJ with MMPL/SSD domain
VKSNRSPMVTRVARWSVLHRKYAVIGWLVLVVLASTAGTLMHTHNASATDQAVGQSGRALRTLQHAGLTPPAAESVLIQSSAGSVTSNDPAFKSAVSDVLAALAKTPAATGVHSPYDSGAISSDHRSALVTFSVAGDAGTADSRITPVLGAVHAAAGRHPGFTIDEVGDASAAKYLSNTFNNDFAKAEWTAVPVALGILLIAFASLVAASLPLILALTAYLMAAGLAAMFSHLLPSTPDASSVMLLVGLAVGVDYCMFYLRRARTERAAGRDLHDSISIAAATSGRSVLVSGVTVVAAMAGMFLTRIADFEAIAASTIIVVVVAVAGSLTVLPALLSMIGDRVDRGRLPILGKRRQAQLQLAATSGGMAGTPRGWARLLTTILSRPLAFTLGCTALLLALAAPLLSMRTAQLSIAQELSPKTAIVRTSAAIDAAFPGSSAPATVVVQAPDITSPQVSAALASFDRQVVQTGHGLDPGFVVHPEHNIAVISLQLAGAGTDRASTQALSYLRGELIPQTFGTVPGTRASVAGVTAESVDFGAQLHRSIVPVFAFVLLLAFVLMLSSFRSITVAGMTVLLNLLSVGSAYGVLTLVFQHNVGASLVGAHPVGAINSWVPIFLFVLLFGLSMDYHVFVVSKIKEGHERGLPTRQAIAEGIGSTASVITSAAMIMVGVFAIFATLSVESMKQVAVGLAVAVFLDATVIRAMLLPAAMAVLGEFNWYLPRWLRWVPELSHSDAGPLAAPTASPPVSVRQPVDAPRGDLAAAGRESGR